MGDPNAASCSARIAAASPGRSGRIRMTGTRVVTASSGTEAGSLVELERRGGIDRGKERAGAAEPVGVGAEVRAQPVQYGAFPIFLRSRSSSFAPSTAIRSSKQSVLYWYTLRSSRPAAHVLERSVPVSSLATWDAGASSANGSAAWSDPTSEWNHWCASARAMP
jgi:hypothetical protein